MMRVMLVAFCCLIRFGLAQEDRPHVVPLQEAGETRSNVSSFDCRLPMKVGPCRAAFPKFFYNATTQNCSSFIYGGCEANGNNFDSQQECEVTCSGVTGSVFPMDSTLPPPQPAAKAPRMAPAAPSETDPVESAPLQGTEKTAAAEYSEHCEAEPMVGPCRAAMNRWFYNTKTGSCETFIYGGCRGNKNNYPDEEGCKATCTGVIQVLPSSKKTSPAEEDRTDVAEHCKLGPEPGPCRAAFSKFFYDSNTASCKNFIYGGCQGNANQFDTMEECMRSCSDEGHIEGHGKTHHWTAAFFLFATLAIVSLLLLATLVVITFRRHRRSRRPSASDKEELLPDEVSSVDSLTITDGVKSEPKA